MPVTAYDLDKSVELRVTFRTDDDLLYNPGTVQLTVQEPDGVLTTYSIGQMSNPSTGVFTKTVSAAKTGWWAYRWNGYDGQFEDSDSSTFYVRIPETSA